MNNPFADFKDGVHGITRENLCALWLSIGFPWFYFGSQFEKLNFINEYGAIMLWNDKMKPAASYENGKEIVVGLMGRVITSREQTGQRINY